MKRITKDLAAARQASEIEQARVKRKNEQHGLRDYFAAQAIGMMAWTDSTLDDCAKASYLIADAMLKARKGDKDA